MVCHFERLVNQIPAKFDVVVTHHLLEQIVSRWGRCYIPGIFKTKRFHDHEVEMNPKTGYLSGFNNKPRDSPYHLAVYHPFERATRFAEIMQEKNRISPEDARKIQMDSVPVVAKRWVPLLLVAAEREKELESYLSLFKGWDFNLAKESSAATLFSAFNYHFLTYTFADEIGETFWKEKYGHIWNVYHPGRPLVAIMNQKDHPWFNDVTTGDRFENRGSISFSNDFARFNIK